MIPIPELTEKAKRLAISMNQLLIEDPTYPPGEISLNPDDNEIIIDCSKIQDKDKNISVTMIFPREMI